MNLSLKNSKDILEGEIHKEDATPKESLQLKGLNPQEKERSVPKEMLSFSALNKRTQEGSTHKDNAERSSAEEKAAPQKQVTEELREAQKESQMIYHELIALAQEVFEKVKEGQTFEIARVRKAIDRLIDELILGDETLIQLVNGPEGIENQFASNAANVTIISIKIGISLQYNKSSLMELGMISFLRDMGLVLLNHLIEQPRRLKAKEYAEIKKHPQYTEKLLDGLGIRDEVFKHVILQHHEREDGSGYFNVKGDAIHEYAKIIAIAEVYESLTHNRPFRAGLPPHTAMREILEEGVVFFGHKVTKAFITEFGVYPVGSTIELNTGETGKVVAVHKDFPLRPVIQLMLDSKDKPTTRILNLLDKPQLFIKRPIEEVQA